MINLGIYTAQLFGSQTFHRLNLILRQTVVLNIFYLVIIPILCFFLVQPMLASFNKDPALIQLTNSAILKLYPILVIRVLNDTLKTLIQNMGKMALLGTINFFNIVVYSIYSWISYSYLGEQAYWANLLMYETCLLCIHAFFIWRLVDERIKDFSLPIFSHFAWYFLECVKTISVTPLELVITYVFISYSGSHSEIAAFSIFIAILDLCFSICMSINTFPRAMINTKLGKKQFGEAKRLTWYYLFVILLISAMTGLLISGILSMVTLNMDIQNPYKPYFERCTIPVGVILVLFTVFGYLAYVGQSIELKMTILSLRLIIGVGVWTVLLYFFIIRWEYRVVGLIYSDIIDQTLRICFALVAISNKNWNKIKGATRLQE